MGSRIHLKRYGFIFSSICLTSCVTNSGLLSDAVSDNNRYHLSKIRKGMVEAQVLQIMRQPHKYENFEIGEDIYDVWFYVTNPTVLGQSQMVAQNLTPLSFKNAVLVGTGYDYYYYITKEMEKQRAAARPPPEPTMPLVQPRAPQTTRQVEPENKDLEESLKKATKPASSPNQENLQPSPKPTAPILSFGFAEKPIAKIRKGMTEEQIKGMMGEPLDTQVFELGEDVYNVWFYEASHRAPLTFKNGQLVGMTREYYDGIRQAAGDDRIEGYDKKGEQMQQDASEQDFDFW